MLAPMPLIESRLHALERQNRRLRLALFLLAITVTAAFALGFSRGQNASDSYEPSAEVKAQRFVLVDSSGREQAVLGLGANGPFLHFLSSGSAAVPVSVDASGIAVHNAFGFNTTLDAGGLVLDSTASRTELKAQSLEMKPASSSATASLRISPDGPSLLLRDAAGGLAALGVHSFVPEKSAVARRTSAAAIALVAPDHRILWSAPPPPARH